MIYKGIRFLHYTPFLFLVGIFLLSCNQNPLFYEIAQEVEPIDPKINGTPTAIVAWDNNLYVASRFSKSLFKYENSGWNADPSYPGDKIIDLAATTTALYALTGDPNSLVIKKRIGSIWSDITNQSGYPIIQSIHGDGARLFVGAQAKIGDGAYAILYEDTPGELKALKSGTKLLKGAAYDGTNYYYLATAGDGIYKWSGSDSGKQVSGTEDVNVVGIINVGDKIVAVSRSAIFYENGSGFTSAGVSVTFTGALGLWKKEGADTNTLLLLGIQGSGTSLIHGYREILLSGGNLTSTGLRTPGEDSSNSSISNYDKYKSGLGRHPVIAIHQAKNGILFAATTKNGLWSYRDRGGGEVWNAED